MDLPLINACLNFISATLLVCGFVAIKKKNKELHKKLMISAFCTSALFLSSYLYYHFTAGHLLFQGVGTVKTIYFIILIPHILLAMIMLPMILMTFFFIFRGQVISHKKIARFTFPVWLYVSVTGVILYLYMYQLYPEHLKKVEPKPSPVEESVAQ
ncbi:DUF420 domain-containing protein [Lentisphaera profundi]|uniref:DUF420 domain-containing protein n=1 Tax=Lentisphaera profundi TaxID=1658616 RepID=A0ABY7VXV5_9BACT|nr:DUF420 domain-containing protein [Lentisphaera profundi]WDE99096.1 DUF420 domain-containing protein [Lentisphaera profundi]